MAIRPGTVCASLGLLAFFAVAQQSPRPAPHRERTLLFVGDVMLARGVGAKMRAENDWTYPFEKIAPTLRAADLAFGNLECPVSDLGRDLRHLYSFRADPGAIEGLKAAGFRVLSLANNHTDDWDSPALLDTLRRLDEAGIGGVGAGENDLAAHYPVLVNLGSVKLSWLTSGSSRAMPRRESIGRASPGSIRGGCWRTFASRGPLLTS
jgi:poly-gamma-glutamate synthesis protein (capsule biosynthesis protein)